MDMADICVVHLVRHENGLEPFIKFIESYNRHSAGIEHDLLIIYKGFSSAKRVSEYEKILSPIPHQTLFVKDLGFDIRPYFIAARKLDYKYFIFLNSFSIILGEKWLDKMYRHVSQEGVGLVGATGSWQSMYTDCFNLSITRDDYTFWKCIFAKCLRRFRLFVLSFFFMPLPNYHIRTNAFMISRELMLKIKGWGILTKRGAWIFESGVHGFTRQVLDMNLKAIIVGRNGVGYQKENWHESNTYKQYGQSNLLIADNQTRTYCVGNNNMRKNESFKAWGNKSDITTTSPEQTIFIV
jgi:hypothetical protein